MLHSFNPILACADTNAAVDNIVDGLTQRGINVARLGQPAKVITVAEARELQYHCDAKAAITAHMGAVFDCKTSVQECS